MNKAPSPLLYEGIRRGKNQGTWSRTELLRFTPIHGQVCSKDVFLEDLGFLLSLFTAMSLEFILAPGNSEPILAEHRNKQILSL